MEMLSTGELVLELADLTLDDNGRGTFWIVPRVRELDLSMLTLVPVGNGSLIGSAR